MLNIESRMSNFEGMGLPRVGKSDPETFRTLENRVFESGDEITVTGLDTRMSYATISEADKTLFESTIGSSASLVRGSAFSSISIEAVHEPATAGLLGISAIVFYPKNGS